MNSRELIERINMGELDNAIISLYCDQDQLDRQKERYIRTIESFEEKYDKDGKREVVLLSVPGRSELSGNHTDHNCGRVIAGAVNLDIICVAAKSDGHSARVFGEGYGESCIDILEYNEPREDLFTTSDSLIAGMCRGFKNNGYLIGGFDAYTSSNVLKGSGLSSSAAFEVMIGTILNHLYNDAKVGAVEIAKIAQYSENVFFGKPCGLMDQTACAVGGIIAIDFKDTTAPVVEKMNVDISKEGFDLCIVDTGGNHADLGEDYASVPSEMKSVAAYFGKKVLREIDVNVLIPAIPELRKSVGDRAILRALHFLNENQRVVEQKNALENGNINKYFEKVLESGRSSFCYLQNVYTAKNLTEQGLSLALCLAEGYLSNKRSAWRVHGGGFAGTIQAYVPFEYSKEFKCLMDSIFGNGACMILKIRPSGAVRIA